MSAIPPEIHCRACGCDLAGSLGTFGEPGQEVCQQCWLQLDEAGSADGPLSIPWREAFADDDGFDPDDNGLVELNGCLYCYACGMLAQPGDEEFDWCDHWTGDDCAYYDEEDDDDDWDEDDW